MSAGGRRESTTPTDVGVLEDTPGGRSTVLVCAEWLFPASSTQQPDLAAGFSGGKAVCFEGFLTLDGVQSLAPCRRVRESSCESATVRLALRVKRPSLRGSRETGRTTTAGAGLCRNAGGDRFAEISGSCLSADIRSTRTRPGEDGFDRALDGV